MCNIIIRLTVKFANFTHFIIRRSFHRAWNVSRAAGDRLSGYNWSFSKVEKTLRVWKGPLNVDQLYNLPLVEAVASLNFDSTVCIPRDS